MFFDYLNAVVIKLWLPLILFGAFGSSPWWGRFLLSERNLVRIDKYLTPARRKLLAVGCLVIAFMCANYLAWEDRYNSIDKLSAENARLKEQLDARDTVMLCGTIEEIALMPAENNDKDLRVLFAVKIYNKGADSAVSDYHARVLIDNQAVSLQPVSTLPKIGLTVNDFNTHERVQTFFQEDSIAIKALIPVKKGEQRRGILLYTIKDGIRFKYENAKWALSFKDYLGKTYEVKGSEVPGFYEKPFRHFPL